MKPNYISKIKEQLPTLSGVYTFRGPGRKPLYIGKAKNLSTRVGSYFHGPKVPMIRTMLKQAKSVTWEETLSDIDALILESALIKKYRPRFNTLLRDDKQYFYVAISREQFPHIIVTHQPVAYAKLKNKNEKIKNKGTLLRVDFIGPFTDGGALKMVLKALRQIFPYCTCKQKHLNYCLNYHIDNCPGFCCLKNINPSTAQLTTYSKNIKNIKDILSGKKQLVLTQLMTQLRFQEISADPQEVAAVQNKILKLKRFFLNTKVIQNQKILNKQLLDMRKHLLLIHLPVRIEGYDISNISGLFATGAMVVFTNGQPDKNEYRKFKIKTVFGANDTAMLREVLERRFNHPEWQSPNLILVDGSKGQVNVVSAVLKKVSLDIPVIGLIKNDRHIGERVLLGHKNKILNLSDLPTNVRNLLLQVDAEAHRFAIQYYRRRHSFKK